MTFYEVLTEAINDMAENGYDSAERVLYWQRRLREAADAMLMSDQQVEDMLRESLRAVYQREVERGGLVRRHPGIDRYTLEQIKLKLRPELDRRILASADLIRLNKKEAVEQTLRRFAGWSTSIPLGGTKQVDRRAEKARMRKSLAQLSFVERRVLIDQGHKLISTVNEIVARDGGAIAGIWHSHWREANYDYRPDHKAIDRKVFAVRDSWAIKRGLMTKGPNGYIDEIPRPAEEPFCRCFYQYVYNLGQLPNDMLTRAGRDALAAAKAKRMQIAYAA